MNRSLYVAQVPEAAACGAALLAGLGSKVLGSPAEAVQNLRYERKQMDPDPAQVEWYEQMYQQVYRPLYQALRPVNDALEHFPKR